jgi:hypothetical protein
MESCKISTEVRSDSLKGDHFENLLKVDVRIIFKSIFKELGLEGVDWRGSE